MDRAESADEPAEWQTRRANTYKLLAECYREPNEELLETIEAIEPADFEIDVSKFKASSGALDELRVDHSKLFVGPFEIPAAPYGSTHLSNDGRVMTDSTIEVQELYREEGLDIGVSEPPDHISAELEFAFVLATRKREAIVESAYQDAADYLRREVDFLDAHLNRWIPTFAEKVDRHASTAFYRSLAAETERFIDEDLRNLIDRRERIANDEQPENVMTLEA